MNTFEWDRNLYGQVSGTAKGTSAAPTFCGLFMGDLEEMILTLWKSFEADSVPEDW